MISILVKGTRAEALAAAFERRIAVSVVWTDTARPETMLLAHESQREAIAAWYCEPTPGSVQYPAGTALLYTTLYRHEPTDVEARTADTSFSGRHEIGMIGRKGQSALYVVPRATYLEFWAPDPRPTLHCHRHPEESLPCPHCD